MAGQITHMINRHLQVATYNNPLAQLKNRAVNTYGLIERDILEILSKGLNFTYSICVPSDAQLGISLGNGTWTGVFGQLMRREADVSFTFTAKTLSRSQVVDLTFPVLTDHLALMIPYPEVENDLSFAVSLSSNIGLALFLASSIIVFILLWIIHRLKNDCKLKWDEMVIFMVAVTLCQGGYIRPKSFAFRIVHGTWIVALFFVLNIFSVTLTSVLMTPRYKYLVQSLEDMITNENIKPLVLKGSPAYGDLITSPSKALKKISARFIQNPKLQVDPSDYIESLLSEPNQVFILSDIVQDFAIGNDVKKIGYCRALTLDKLIMSRNNCFMLQKDSFYTPTFNKKVLLLAQSGLPEYLKKKYTSSSSKCSIHKLKIKDRRPTSIKLSQLWNIFLIWSKGCLLCIVLFLGELLLNFIYRQQWSYRNGV